MIKKRISAALLLWGITLWIGAHSPRPIAQVPTPVTVARQVPDIETIDLSDWVKEYSKLGITSFRRNELFMKSKSAGYYYVLVAPDEYSTEGATTGVTLRNIDGAKSYLGYGLIFHSDPTPLKQDYAFLIDTVGKRFRVVRHSANDEKRVISWTASLFINSGSQENTLQVRDCGAQTELYINGHLATTVENTFAYKGGAPGLYTDVTNIAFRDLTIDHRGGLPTFK